jgi:hypothetical protein
MSKAVASIALLVAALAVGMGVAAAHTSKIRTRVVGASSTTGHFYESGRPAGAYTTVQGFVRAKRVKCERGRRVTAYLLDTQTGDRKRLRNPSLTDADGKFGVDTFDYTPRFDRAVISVQRKFLRKTASHRHICKRKRLTIPHKDEG